MVYHPPIIEHPLDENGMEISTHKWERRYFQNPADYNAQGHASHRQGAGSIIASNTDWDSPVDFLERSFRLSMDLSTLTASMSLDHRSFNSDGTPIPFTESCNEAIHSDREMGSISSLLSSQHPSNRIQTSPSSNYAPAKTSTSRMWNPIWLTKAVLMNFFVLFVVLFFVVLALYLYSEAHSGLLNGSEGSHYLWTYLPTTVFILTASLWHRVEFYCKELTPYYNMRHGPTPANQSILLDYIVPVLPTSLWKALKNGHWAVVASITVDLMLKLCIILSAGLLLLARAQISRSTNSLVALSNFSAAHLNLDDVGADPVEAFYGAKVRGLPWAYGTTENLTVQTFSYNGSDGLTDALLTADISGFSVAMDCNLAQITAGSSLISRPWAGGPGSGILSEFLVANISGPGCELTGVSLGQTPSNMEFQIVNQTTRYQSNYQGVFDYYVCNSGFNYINAENPYVPQPNATSPDDYRFLLTMSEVSWYFVFNNSAENDP